MSRRAPSGLAGVLGALLLLGCAQPIVRGGRADLDRVAEITRATSEIRQLPSRREVPVVVVSRQEAARRLKADFRRDNPVPSLRRLEEALVLLGALPEGTDLEQTLLGFYSEQVAGFYDPRRAELALVDRPGSTPLSVRLLSAVLGRDILGEFTIAHEYAHALQDQHFQLETFLSPAGAGDDAVAARRALVEGDATAAAVEVLLRGTGRSFQGLEALDASAIAGGAEPTGGAPRFLVELALATYVDGLSFVKALHRHGGWPEVDRAYRDPPASTEQVRHPEKYLAGEDPVQMAQLPIPPGVPPALLEGVAGEQAIAVLLGPEAGAGWGGDRFGTFAAPGGPYLAWASVWDTPADAEEFCAALATLWSGPAPSHIARDGRRVLALRGAASPAWGEGRSPAEPAIR